MYIEEPHAKLISRAPLPRKTPSPKRFPKVLSACGSALSLSPSPVFSHFYLFGLKDHTSSLGIMASEDEDDYMNMVIEEPTQKETFTQKKRRELREVPYPPTF